MSTPAQITANQLNSQSSTGPRTPEGKSKSARNATKLGLFSVHSLVHPDCEDEYRELSAALWHELLPEGALQESIAVEIVRATWRLQRCARVESDVIDSFLETGLDPMQNEATGKTQTAVDRARAQSHNILRRALADLRRLQTDRAIAREIHPAKEAPQNGLVGAKEVAEAARVQNKARLLARKLDELDSFEKLLDKATAPPPSNMFTKQTHPLAA